MSIDVNSITHVWFQAPSTVVDLVHPSTGKPVYGKAEPTDCERITFDEAIRRQDEHWRSPPTEITWAQFDEALNVLPPVAWCNWSDAESFKISEMTAGTITAIYCRLGADSPRYFHLSDNVTLRHDAIVAKCLAVSS